MKTQLQDTSHVPTVQCHENDTVAPLAYPDLLPAKEYKAAQSDQERIIILKKVIKDKQLWETKALVHDITVQNLRKVTADCLNGLRAKGSIR